jgi:hypothetical protein
MFVSIFVKVGALVQKVHVMTHKLHCYVVMPTVLYLGRNVDEMEMLGLTFNTEFRENSSLSSNFNILLKLLSPTNAHFI